MSFGVIACVSPRENCEEYRSVDNMRDTCMLDAALVDQCRQDVSAGLKTQDECIETEQLMLLTCVLYANDSERCSKEIDLPLVPKIVNRHLKPDAAGFIRWRMALYHTQCSAQARADIVRRPAMVSWGRP